MQRTAPVMADGRNRIRAAGQRERKVSARTILTSNSLLLFPERVGQNNTSRLNNAFASNLWGEKSTKMMRHFKLNNLFWMELVYLCLET